MLTMQKSRKHFPTFGPINMKFLAKIKNRLELRRRPSITGSPKQGFL